MRASSLQLESSAITRLHVEVNRDFPTDDASASFSDFAGAGLESGVEFGPDENAPRRYFLKLEVRLPGTEATPCPYTLNLEVIGIFRCTGGEVEDDEKLVGVNGPAVLYGSVRELVMLITSRGPFPPMVLPTVNFVPPDLTVDAEGHAVATSGNNPQSSNSL